MAPLNFAPASAPNISYGNVASDIGQSISQVLSGIEKKKLEQQKLAMEQALNTSQIGLNTAQVGDIGEQTRQRNIANTADRGNAIALYNQAVSEANDIGHPELVASTIPQGISYQGAKDILESVRQYANRKIVASGQHEEHRYAAMQRRISQIDTILNGVSGMMMPDEDKMRLQNERNQLYESVYGSQYPQGETPVAKTPVAKTPVAKPGLISRAASGIAHGIEHGAQALFGEGSPPAKPWGRDNPAAAPTTTPPTGVGTSARLPVANDLKSRRIALAKQLMAKGLSPDSAATMANRQIIK